MQTPPAGDHRSQESPVKPLSVELDGTSHSFVLSRHVKMDLHIESPSCGAIMAGTTPLVLNKILRLLI